MPHVAIFDDVGVGKSKQLVDAVEVKVEEREIDTLVVVAPGFARSVWREPNPLLGEFAKHAWSTIPYSLHDYGVKSDKLPAKKPGTLQVLVTNYEFLRRNIEVAKGDEPYPNWPKKRTWPRLLPLYEWMRDRKVWLALDESWAIENHESESAVASWLLRTVSKRVTLMNGTPGPIDKQFAQIQILHPNILGVRNFYHFRGHYCELGDIQTSTKTYKKIVGYKNLDEYARRTGPYVLRRRAREVLSFLPKRLPPGIIEARLSPKEWAVYKNMRDDLVAWIDKNKVSAAMTAGVKSLRLTQITAGYIGGVVSEDPQMDMFSDEIPRETHEIGRAKLDAVKAFLAAQDLKKAVLWGRWKPEIERMVRELKEDRPVFELHGATPDDERMAAKVMFAPPDNDESAYLVGHPGAGGAGLNFSAASLMIYVSNTWSLRERDQSEGRIDRPGQTLPCRFYDVVAVGPNGQRTVDHAMIDALRSQTNAANWTPDEWKSKLLSE